MTTPDSARPVQSFAYQAQTPQGQTLTGTIDATDVDAATQTLASLHLRVTAMEQSPRPKSGGAMLRGADFLAFNQQLSHLTAAGLPVERSLRLLAREMGGRRAAAVNAIAEELEKGTPLEAAFEKYASIFPPLYGMLIHAGMKASDLPAMLLNLGRHVEMIQRLRAAFWRAATYPLAVMAALLVVLGFLWLWVIPQLATNLVGGIIRDFHLEMPFAYYTVIAIAQGIDITVMIVVAAILFLTALFFIVSRFPGGSKLTQRMLMPMPLVGRILRLNLLARWCDAFFLATTGGLDLPTALTLAGTAVDSDPLSADSKKLADAVSAGQPIDAAQTRVLPPVVPAALRLGAENHDIPATANMLAKMYQEQAELRLAILPQLLSPIFMIVAAICIGLAVLTVVLPILAFTTLVMGMSG
jgi:type IV pilus assembly protein PilC